ncbi:MAG: sigma-70 family RNA polymerase sigma factor, partial [Chloroflexota bacterium]
MNTEEKIPATRPADQEIGDLVRETLSGKTAAYEVIINRFEKMAYSHAIRMLGEPQDAQDAVQEAFWEAYQALPKLRTPEAFPGWFRRIVLKQADRQLRSRFKGKASDLGSQLDHMPVDNQKTVSEQVDATAEKQFIYDGIALLPEAQSQAISLHYLNGYSQKEISSLLQLPITTIKKRLHDARVNLKRQLILMNKDTNITQEKDSKAQLIAFYIALRANDLTTIKKQLKANPELVNVLSEWTVASDTYYWPLGVTPLSWSAGVGNIELSKILLEHGAVIDGLESEPFTPLHHAIITGQAEMVRFLLDSGAEVNQKAQNGLTSLHYAVLREELEIAEMLLGSGVALEAKDNFEQTAVEWAQTKGLSDFGQLLNFKLPADQAAATQSQLRQIPNIEKLAGRIINSQGQSLDKRPLKPDGSRFLNIPVSQNHVFETGVKVVDLCVPIRRGSCSAVFTPLSGVGRLMIQAQFMYSMVYNYDGYVVYLGIEQGENTANALKMQWLAESNMPSKMLEDRFIMIF